MENLQLTQLDEKQHKKIPFAVFIENLEKLIANKNISKIMETL